MKKTFLELAKRYADAIQGKLDLSNNEFEAEPINNGVNIALKDGYWQINNKPLIKCSIVKQNLFDQYLRMKFMKQPIVFESSFKYNAKEVKERLNYSFKMREQDFIGNYPNIESVQFIKA
jgi:hypothetical protein